MRRIVNTKSDLNLDIGKMYYLNTRIESKFVLIKVENSINNPIRETTSFLIVF